MVLMFFVISDDAIGSLLRLAGSVLHQMFSCWTQRFDISFKEGLYAATLCVSHFKSLYTCTVHVLFTHSTIL